MGKNVVYEEMGLGYHKLLETEMMKMMMLR